MCEGDGDGDKSMELCKLPSSDSWKMDVLLGEL